MDCEKCPVKDECDCVVKGLDPCPLVELLQARWMLRPNDD